MQALIIISSDALGKTIFVGPVGSPGKAASFLELDGWVQIEDAGWVLGRTWSNSKYPNHQARIEILYPQSCLSQALPMM